VCGLSIVDSRKLEEANTSPARAQAARRGTYNVANRYVENAVAA